MSAEDNEMMQKSKMTNNHHLSTMRGGNLQVIPDEESKTFNKS